MHPDIDPGVLEDGELPQELVALGPPPLPLGVALPLGAAVPAPVTVVLPSGAECLVKFSGSHSSGNVRAFATCPRGEHTSGEGDRCQKWRQLNQSPLRPPRRRLDGGAGAVAGSRAL